MKIFRHVVLALIVVAPLLLADAGQAEAALWDSPSGHHWTIDPVCRDGVKITMMERLYTDDPSYVLTLNFSASAKLFSGKLIPQVQKHDHPLTDTIVQPLGSVGVTKRYHRSPKRWVDDETGERGITHVYGSSNLYWDNDMTLLPGRHVIVKLTGPTNKHFLGVVTNCWL